MAIGKLFSPQTLKMVSTLGKAPSPPDGLGPFIGCRAAIRERQPQRKLSPPRRALQRGSLEATQKLRGFGAGPRIGMGGYREKIKRGPPKRPRSKSSICTESMRTESVRSEPMRGPDRRE